MKKYVCELGMFSSPKITEVECEKETVSSVWIGGRRSAKRSEWKNYFDTWEDAHKALLESANKKLASAKLALDRVKGICENIKCMSR